MSHTPCYISYVLYIPLIKSIGIIVSFDNISVVINFWDLVNICFYIGLESLNRDLHIGPLLQTVTVSGTLNTGFETSLG